MSKLLIERSFYLNQLQKFKDNGLIKVIVGIRRCGKSQLLLDFSKRIKKDSNTIFINLESREYADIDEWTTLYDNIYNKIDKNNNNYIFLDEIQEIPEFQKAINSLHLLPNVDIYITGSNAFMLSSELVTYLTGRYLQIQMFPLSFYEFSLGHPDIDKYSLFDHYLNNSSFPEVLDFEKFSDEGVNNYLSTIYETVVKKDVIIKNSVKDNSKLLNVTQFIMANIGNILSPKKISDTLTSMNRPVSNHSIENYISWLINSYLIYPSQRFDIVGKQLLETNQKYYCVDLGLRRFLQNGPGSNNKGFEIENLVYLELRRRFPKVYTGKVRDFEIDFVCEDFENNLNFFQVSLSLSEKATLERELRALRRVKYQGNKFLLTLDPLSENHDGIKQINLIDWLLNI